LEAPIRAWIGWLADKIRTVRRPGADSDYDTSLIDGLRITWLPRSQFRRRWRKTPGSI
jgi:hypothetical protein